MEEGEGEEKGRALALGQFCIFQLCLNLNGRIETEFASARLLLAQNILFGSKLN